MLRLAHRIMTQKPICESFEGMLPWKTCGMPYDPQAHAHQAALAKLFMPRNTIVIADDVAAFFDNSDQKEWNARRDTPACPPLSEGIFIEWNGNERDKANGISQLGVFLIATSMEQFDEQKAEMGWIGQHIAPHMEANRDRLGWCMLFTLWQTNLRDGRPWCSPHSSILFLDKEGRVDSSATADGFRSGAINEQDGTLSIPLLALAFANCKNVTARDSSAEHNPDKKWLKRQKAPELRYNTIEIGGMVQTLKSKGGLETNGIKKALHLCRGHFATYTEERPMFGRLVGQYYRPQHIRGSAEHGVVLSDYKVKVPTDPMTPSLPVLELTNQTNQLLPGS